MRLKREACDEWFSNCVREAADWQCESCGVIDNDGQASGKSQTMQCCHIISRTYAGSRFMAANAVCMCAACHVRFTRDPLEFASWVRKELGEGLEEIIRERARAPTRNGKEDKRNIAAHYRAEYQRLRALRKQGVSGKLQFLGWE